MCNLSLVSIFALFFYFLEHCDKRERIAFWTYRPHVVWVFKTFYFIIQNWWFEMGSQFINFKIKTLLNLTLKLKSFLGLIKTSCVQYDTQSILYNIIFFVENSKKSKIQFDATQILHIFGQLRQSKIRYPTKFNMRILFNLGFLKLMLYVYVWIRLGMNQVCSSRFGSLC